ncbi:hypothetical protein J6590_077731 [Homalodisca vitripennis]|nr:hypothetical protein J6590_077731 [Homalodisca vitripennis]
MSKIFLPWTTAESASVELIYIYGMTTVNFTENSFTTERPITLFIQNCSYVNINDHSIEKLRTLLIRDADRVDVGILPQEYLWTTVLEDIKQLSISSASLSALYSVMIGHIGSLSLVPTTGDDLCSANPDFTFTLLTSQITDSPKHSSMRTHNPDVGQRYQSSPLFPGTYRVIKEVDMRYFASQSQESGNAIAKGIICGLKSSLKKGLGLGFTWYSNIDGLNSNVLTGCENYHTCGQADNNKNLRNDLNNFNYLAGVMFPQPAVLRVVLYKYFRAHGTPDRA